MKVQHARLRRQILEDVLGDSVDEYESFRKGDKQDSLRKQHRRRIPLWKFLLHLLKRDTSSTYIHWDRREPLEFRIKNTTAVADLWGSVKNKNDMTYEKLGRAMRYYYGKHIIEKVSGRRYTYRFILSRRTHSYISKFIDVSQLKSEPMHEDDFSDDLSVSSEESKHFETTSSPLPALESMTPPTTEINFAPAFPSTVTTNLPPYSITKNLLNNTDNNNSSFTNFFLNANNNNNITNNNNTIADIKSYDQQNTFTASKRSAFSVPEKQSNLDLESLLSDWWSNDLVENSEPIVEASQQTTGLDIESHQQNLEELEFKLKLHRKIDPFMGMCQGFDCFNQTSFADQLFDDIIFGQQC